MAEAARARLGLTQVAVPAVLEGAARVRPQAAVTELPDVGDYPQIECPNGSPR